MSVSSTALCLTLKVVNGIFGFWTERDWGQKSYYGKGVIFFFCDGIIVRSRLLVKGSEDARYEGGARAL